MSIMPIFAASSQVTPVRDADFRHPREDLSQLKVWIPSQNRSAIKIQMRSFWVLEIKTGDKSCNPTQQHNKQPGTPQPIRRAHVTGSGRSRLGRWPGLSRRNRPSRAARHCLLSWQLGTVERRKGPRQQPETGPRHIHHQTKRASVDRSGWREDRLGHERRSGLVSSSADEPDQPDQPDQPDTVAGATAAAETTTFPGSFPIPLGRAIPALAPRSNPMADAHETRGDAERGEAGRVIQETVAHGQLRLPIAADQPRWLPSPQICAAARRDAPNHPQPPAGGLAALVCTLAARFAAAACRVARDLRWSLVTSPGCPASAPDGNCEVLLLPNRALQLIELWMSSANASNPNSGRRQDHTRFPADRRLDKRELATADPGTPGMGWPGRRHGGGPVQS